MRHALLQRYIRLKPGPLPANVTSYVNKIGIIRDGILQVHNLKRLHVISARLKSMNVDHYIHSKQPLRQVKGLEMMSLNVNGIDRRDVLLHVEQRAHNKDIILLQETRKRVELEGFTSYYNASNNGTSILIKNYHKNHQRIEPDFEYGCITEVCVNTDRGVKRAIVGSVYIPQKGKNAALKVVFNLINRLCRRYHYVMIGGDYNTYFPQMTKYAQKLDFKLNSSGQVTRCEGKHCIDYILSNKSLKARYSLDLSWFKSDHYPVCMSVKLKGISQECEKFVYNDLNGLKEKLDTLAEELDGLKETNLDGFTTICSNYTKKFQSEKTRRSSKFAWISHTTKKAMHKLREYKRGYYALLTTLSDTDLVEENEAENVSLITEKKDTIKLLKKDILKQLSEDTINAEKRKAMKVSEMNSREMWKHVKLSSSSKIDRSIVLKVNNTLVTKPADVAKVFLDKFTTIFQTEKYFDQITIPNQPHKCHPDDVLLQREFNTMDITLALRLMAKYKARGTDNIPGEVYKYCKAMPLILLPLLNRIWTTGKYPDSWNESYVIPIYKKGNRQDCSNYRPITIMNALAKLYSILITQRLNQVIEKYHLIKPEQAGFTKGKNSVQQTTVLHELCDRRRVCKKDTMLLFVDFAKAYDTVNHSILFAKLKHYGISGRLLNNVISMYKDPRICIRVGNTDSEYISVKCGLKQGDPASPVLFNLYINDLLDVFSGIDAPAIENNHNGDKYTACTCNPMYEGKTMGVYVEHSLESITPPVVTDIAVPFIKGMVTVDTPQLIISELIRDVEVKLKISILPPHDPQAYFKIAGNERKRYYIDIDKTAPLGKSLYQRKRVMNETLAKQIGWSRMHNWKYWSDLEKREAEKKEKKRLWKERKLLMKKRKRGITDDDDDKNDKKKKKKKKRTKLDDIFYKFCVYKHVPKRDDTVLVQLPVLHKCTFTKMVNSFNNEYHDWVDPHKVKILRANPVEPIPCKHRGRGKTTTYTRKGVELSSMKVRGLLYADDLVIMSENKDKLIEDVVALKTWCANNCMSVNIAKCGYMIVKHKKSVIDDDDTAKELYYDSDTKFPYCDVYRYLGIEFQDNLEFDKVILDRCSKTEASIRMFTKYLSKRSTSIMVKCHIVRSILTPILLYGVEYWCISKEKLLDKISKCYNKCIRTSFGLGQKYSADMMSYLVHLKPLEAQIISRAYGMYRKGRLRSDLFRRMSVIDPDNRTPGLTWLDKFHDRIVDFYKKHLTSDVISSERYHMDNYSAQHQVNLTLQMIRNLKLTSEIFNSCDSVLPWRLDIFSVEYVKHFKSMRHLIRILMNQFSGCERLAERRELNEMFKYMCPMCGERSPETLSHYLLVCKKFESERNISIKQGSSSSQVAPLANRDLKVELYFTLGISSFDNFLLSFEDKRSSQEEIVLNRKLQFEVLSRLCTFIELTEVFRTSTISRLKKEARLGGLEKPPGFDDGDDVVEVGSVSVGEVELDEVVNNDDDVDDDVIICYNDDDDVSIVEDTNIVITESVFEDVTVREDRLMLMVDDEIPQLPLPPALLSFTFEEYTALSLPNYEVMTDNVVSEVIDLTEDSNFGVEVASSVDLLPDVPMASVPLRRSRRLIRRVFEEVDLTDEV